LAGLHQKAKEGMATSCVSYLLLTPNSLICTSVVLGGSFFFEEEEEERIGW